MTEALGDPPEVYGERIAAFEDRILRRWEPGRSKLAAAILRGYEGPLPSPSEKWLYLGAASGTTASHVADLVGGEGTVYAVEKSLRPIVRLLRLAERYPNLLPILGDARRPDELQRGRFALRRALRRYRAAGPGGHRARERPAVPSSGRSGAPGPQDRQHGS